MPPPPQGTLIYLLLTPGFNLAATMSFVDPFRSTNYLEGVSLFRWTFLSENGGMIRASNGAGIETIALEAVDEDSPDFLVVSSSWEPEAHVSQTIRAALRRAARRRVTLGGIDTGAFILAHAGLLTGHKATVHYEHIDAFQELFRDTEVLETLWVFDGQRITCCGGAAATEFALHIVQMLHGDALANAAARYLFAPQLRDHAALQSPQDLEPVGATVPDTVRMAVRVMEENLETPISIADICDRIKISHRQLDRLFQQYVRKSPALYYRDARLDRARGLVTQTSLPMTEIAYASGFSSQGVFSRAYRARFGLAPREDRIQGRIPFEFRAWPMHRRRDDPAN